MCHVVYFQIVHLFTRLSGQWSPPTVFNERQDLYICDCFCYDAVFIASRSITFHCAPIMASGEIEVLQDRILFMKFYVKWNYDFVFVLFYIIIKWSSREGYCTNHFGRGP